MTTDPANDIKFGLAIYTIDNEKIGTVKNVLPEFVEVDAPLQPDYWLSRKTVQSFTAERVTLMFTKEHLSDYKLDEPQKRGDAAA